MIEWIVIVLFVVLLIVVDRVTDKNQPPPTAWS